MANILWGILFVILCVGVPYAYYKKGIKMSVALAYTAGVIIFAKLLYEENGLGAVLPAFVFSAQLFTFGVNGRELVQIVDSVKDGVSISFVACVWASYLLCPVLTVSVVLTYIKRGLDRTTLRTRFFNDIYIFTEKNQKSLLLSEDICSRNKRALCVFLDADTTDVGTRRICVFYTVAQTLRLINKTNRVHICFNDTDTGELLDKLKKFLSLTEKNSAEVFVFSDNAIAYEVIDKIKAESVNKPIKVISPKAILMREILWDYPLYLNMHKEDEINVTVIGVGGFGGYFAMNTLWCATMPGCKLKLNLVDMDDEENIISRVSENIPSGHFDIEVFKDNASTNGFFERISDSRLKDSDYIMVSMGSDDINISVSRRIKLYFARCSKKPFIITVLKNQSKFDVMKQVLKNEGICVVGGEENTYSYNGIFDDRFLKRAFEVYRIVEEHYGNTADEMSFYKQNQIDIFSSYANAVHCKYKVYALAGNTDISRGELEELLKANLDRIIESEHNRWINFEMLKGFIGVAKEDLEEFFESNKSSGKIHKNTALKMHACITDINGVEEIDKMLFEKYNIHQNLKEIDELISGKTADIWFEQLL